jgi:hypothetical protein
MRGFWLLSLALCFTAGCNLFSSNEADTESAGADAIDIIDLPENFNTWLQPIREGETCWAYGPSKLALLRHDSGSPYILIEYRDGPGPAIDSIFSECEDRTKSTITLERWENMQRSVKRHHRNQTEEQRRRAAERRLLQ